MSRGKWKPSLFCISFSRLRMVSVRCPFRGLLPQWRKSRRSLVWLDLLPSSSMRPFQNGIASPLVSARRACCGDSLTVVKFIDALLLENELHLIKFSKQMIKWWTRHLRSCLLGHIMWSSNGDFSKYSALDFSVVRSEVAGLSLPIADSQSPPHPHSLSEFYLFWIKSCSTGMWWEGGCSEVEAPLFKRSFIVWIFIGRWSVGASLPSEKKVVFVSFLWHNSFEVGSPGGVLRYRYFIQLWRTISLCKWYLPNGCHLSRFLCSI